MSAKKPVFHPRGDRAYQKRVIRPEPEPWNGRPDIFGRGPSDYDLNIQIDLILTAGIVVGATLSCPARDIMAQVTDQRVIERLQMTLGNARSGVVGGRIDEKGTLDLDLKGPRRDA